jgi:hypothetical protein
LIRLRQRKRIRLRRRKRIRLRQRRSLRLRRKRILLRRKRTHLHRGGKDGPRGSNSLAPGGSRTKTPEIGVEGAKMLEGKKTYISAGLLALMTFARSMGWLDQQQFDLMLGLLGSMGLAALRAGVSKY